MSRVERREYLVGILTTAVFIAILFMSAMANQLRADADRNRFHLLAEFGRVDGIHVGSPVYMAGLPVGQVVDMDLSDRFRAVLTLQFSRDLSFPDDTSAAVQTDGMFGTKFIEVQPGGSFDMLDSGDRISYVQDSVIIEELVTRIVNEAKAARGQSEKDLHTP